jgi:hypothetical protein
VLRDSFPTNMIRRARVAPAVQMALHLAVLMSLAGALGLHPEPDLAAGPHSASSPAWVSIETQPASNDCPICLSHRSVSLTGLSGVALQPGPPRAATPSLEPPPPSLPTLRRHEDRAPPSA